jgi:hypothetical protein
LTDSGEVTQVAAPVVEPLSGGATVPATTAVAAEAEAKPPARRKQLLAIGGIVAAVLLGAAVAAFLLLNRDGGDESQANTGAFTNGAVATVTAGAPATPAPQPTAPRSGDTPVGPPLLAPGEEKALANTGRVEFDLSANGCAGVKTILQPRTIKAETSGRVVVAFTVEVPRVEGVECVVDYGRDATSGVSVLQTRTASGATSQARNTGGSGVAVTGAQDIYGAAPVSGEWWWDRGVDLNGDELNLLRVPQGSDVPLFRLPLLRR